MNGRRMIESMKEALAIAEGALQEETYKVHIPSGEQPERSFKPNDSQEKLPPH